MPYRKVKNFKFKWISSIFASFRWKTKLTVEFFGHQINGQNLINTADTRRIDLTKVQCVTLQKLLEHDTIHACFARCNANAQRSYGCGDFGMAEGIVRWSWLLNPPNTKVGQLMHPVDGLGYVPNLIGVDHLWNGGVSGVSIEWAEYGQEFLFGLTNLLFQPISSRTSCRRWRSSAIFCPTFTLNASKPWARYSLHSWRRYSSV